MKKIELMKKLEDALLFALVFVTAASCRDGVAREACRRAALPAAEVRAAADDGRTDGRDGTDGGETGRAACAGVPVAKSDGRIPPSAKKAKAGAHSARPDCPFGEERLFLPGKP